MMNTITLDYMMSWMSLIHVSEYFIPFTFMTYWLPYVFIGYYVSRICYIMCMGKHDATIKSLLVIHLAFITNLCYHSSPLFQCICMLIHCCLISIIYHNKKILASERPTILTWRWKIQYCIDPHYAMSLINRYTQAIIHQNNHPVYKHVDHWVPQFCLMDLATQAYHQPHFWSQCDDKGNNVFHVLHALIKQAKHSFHRANLYCIEEEDYETLRSIVLLNPTEIDQLSLEDSDSDDITYFSYRAIESLRNINKWNNHHNMLFECFPNQHALFNQLKKTSNHLGAKPYTPPFDTEKKSFSQPKTSPTCHDRGTSPIIFAGNHHDNTDHATGDDFHEMHRLINETLHATRQTLNDNCKTLETTPKNTNSNSNHTNAALLLI